VGLPRITIVGHSWGGGFALRFAELHPDRVDRLALIAPGGLDVRDVWEFRLMRIPLLGEVAVCLTSAVSARHMLRKSFAHRKRITYNRMDDVLRARRSPGKRLARLRDMLRVERSVRWADTERDLHRVQLPTLIIWGDQDRYFPVSLIDRFTARLPTAAIHIVPWGRALTA
jgi:pimeloyl-ACP methyl ester carboxylesterase